MSCPWGSTLLGALLALTVGCAGGTGAGDAARSDGAGDEMPADAQPADVVMDSGASLDRSSPDASADTLAADAAADLSRDGVPADSADAPSPNVDAAAAVPCASGALLLPYQVLAVAFSRAQRQLLIVPTTEPTLHLIDPETCTDTALPLEAPGLSIAVSPNGLTAAVGHNAKVTGIDVAQRRIIRTSVVSATVRPLAVDDAGRAFTFDPGQGFDRSRVLTVTLATGDIQSGAMVEAAGSFVIHPAGGALYHTSADQTWDDLTRLDVSGAAAVIEHARNTFAYDIGGRLFLSGDGVRVFTGTHIVLRASASDALDFTFDGTLEGVERVRDLDAPAGSDRLALIAAPASIYSPNALDQSIRVHDTRFLNVVATIPLPAVPPPPGSPAEEPMAVHARRVFMRPDGNGVYVLFQRSLFSSTSSWGILRIVL
jgi:hypothetical protein